MDAELKFFEGMDLSKDEEEFLKSVLASRNEMFNPRVIEGYKVISNFYLAKSNEKLSKSNDKYSKTLNWLTFGLIIIGVSQIVTTVFIK